MFGEFDDVVVFVIVKVYVYVVEVVGVGFVV